MLISSVFTILNTNIYLISLFNTTMHLVNVAAFACTVLSVSAFEFPDFVPLHRRQDPGTPAYECHANCGMLHIL